MGGHEQARRIWRNYFPEVNGIVFLVDAADLEQLTEARAELSKLLATEELIEVPFLILENKIDADGALSEEEFREAMDLWQTTGKGRVHFMEKIRPIEVFMWSIYLNPLFVN